MPSCSFIIPALNEAGLLPDLLKSIEALEQDDQIKAIECIVVDAGSTDNTIAIAESFGCKIIHSSPGNISRSRNTGAQAAQGDILAFIDADCELPENWLIDVATQLSNSEIVAVGMSMKLKDPSTWVEKTWFELAHRNSNQDLVSTVEWLPSFNLAVKKQMFNLVEGFDETLATTEDYELGLRLSTTGTLVRLESESGVVHHGESKTLSEFFRREAWRARGEISLLGKNRRDVKTVLSFLLPMVVVGGMLCALAIVTLAVTTRYFSWQHFVAITFFGVLPTILLALRRRVSFKHLAPSWLLLNTYFVARTFGTFRQFRRVTR